MTSSSTLDSVTAAGMMPHTLRLGRALFRLCGHLTLWMSQVSVVTVSWASDRPNVLLIIADDLNCAIEPYDPQGALTPNLNRLSSRGLWFDNAFCQQAVCNPSRSSLLTGLRPNSVGVDDLRKAFRMTAADGRNLVTLPEYFKNQGYFCQDIGKIFHNMGETQDRRSWSVDESFFRGTHASDTVFANTPKELRMTGFSKAPVTESLDVPDLAYRDGQIANLAAATLRNISADSSQPFFLAVGFWRPHLPFVAPKKYWDLYDPAKIPPPNPIHAPRAAPPIALHDSREIRSYGDLRKDAKLTEQQVRHFRHGYFASISFLDAQVGKILDALNEAGHSDNTIVVFTSDHGFHIGEHGLWGKTTNFELDARVPLLIADPDSPNSHGRRSVSLFELVDLYPTLANLANIAGNLGEQLEGVDQSAVLDTPEISVKEFALTQHQQPFYGSRENWQAWGYSLRTADWRYTEWRNIDNGDLLARELYDHREQRQETDNVAMHNADVVETLSAVLKAQFSLPSNVKH